MNRREMEEAKNITSKKTATRKVQLQLKRSEAFDMCINSMNSLSYSTADEYRFIQLIQQLSNTIKDAFVHIGGKFSKLPNKRRDTVAREMIWIMKWWSTIKWRANIIISSYHTSPQSSCHPTLPHGQPHHHPTPLLPVYITLLLKLYMIWNANNSSAGGAIGIIGGVRPLKLKSEEGGGSAAITGTMRK